MFSKSPFNQSQFKQNIFSKSQFSPILTETTVPQLDAPYITISQDSENDENITISWNPVANAQNYRIYIDGNSVDTITTNTFNWTFDRNGSFQIYVRAYAPNFRPSINSNIITVVVSNVGNFLSDGVLRFITANLKRILIKK